MSDTDSSSNSSFAGFGKFVPGFDFLQNLATQATQAAGSAAQKIPQLPNLGNWVAPTINVEELDRRIDELKAVQFWLDQNATALKATIQALEVQKMTLATLKGMNFNMGDVANAFKLKVADTVAGGVQRAADKAKTFSGLEIPASIFQAGNNTQQQTGSTENSTNEVDAKETAKAPAVGGVVDPMQWWGALTQQFQAIAADAMKEAAKKTAMDTATTMATGLAKGAMKNATGLAKSVAMSMTSSASKKAAGSARAAVRSSPARPAPVPAARKTAVAKKAASRAKPALKSAR